MFWITILFASALCVGITQTSAILKCECWDGYKADYNENGAQCVGVDILHIMPCNRVKPPRCECSGEVTGILSDKTGTWCTKYLNGQELKRWACENTEEWQEFFQKNPDYT